MPPDTHTHTHTHTHTLAHEYVLRVKRSYRRKEERRLGRLAQLWMNLFVWKIHSDSLEVGKEVKASNTIADTQGAGSSSP